MAMLTKRQKQVYDFVKLFIKKKGFAPSLEEVKKHLKLSSVSTAHHHMKALERLGFLKREENQPRAIDVFEVGQMVTIPLLGAISAGMPIEAIEDKETIAVQKSRLPKTGEFYALRVKGTSMIDENIDDGDIVVIKNQPTADNGDKIVALIDNTEVTLKKIFKENKKIRLQPANPELKPIYIEPKNLTIQGKVIDIIKAQESTPQIAAPEQETLFSKSRSNNEKLPLNTITCDDSIELMKKMPADSVDLVIADPPYNLSKGNSWSWKGNKSLPGFGGAWNKTKETWDNMPLNDYLSFTVAWLSEVKRLLKSSGSIWVFGTYHNIGIINIAFQLLGIEIINEVVWYKRNSFPNLSGRRLTASHETLLWGHVGGKKRKYHFNYKKSKDFFSPSDKLKAHGKQMRTVWDIPNNKNREELKYGKHPTQKPLSICRRIILLSSKEDDVVFSPFAGVGSECLASKILNRQYVGIEKEKSYVEIAQKRLKNTRKLSQVFQS